MALTLLSFHGAFAATISEDVAPSRPQAPLTGAVEKTAIPRSTFHERTRPVITPEILLTAGYLTAKDRSFGQIVDFEQDTYSAGPGDLVYVNKGSKNGVKAGDQFYVYSRSAPVEDPDTGLPAGYIVTVTGVIELVTVKETVSSAKLVTSFDLVFRKQDIVPKYTVVAPKMDPDRPLEEKEIEGKIVRVHYGNMEIGQYDVVYLDAGKDKNVKDGDIFAVIKKKAPKDDDEEDGRHGIDKRIGSVQVVLTHDNTATAIVLDSTSEMKAGDRVSYVQER